MLLTLQTHHTIDEQPVVAVDFRVLVIRDRSLAIDLQLLHRLFNVLMLLSLSLLDERLEELKDLLAQTFVGGTCRCRICELFQLFPIIEVVGEGCLSDLTFNFDCLGAKFPCHDQSALLDLFTLLKVDFIDHVGAVVLITDLN